MSIFHILNKLFNDEKFLNDMCNDPLNSGYSDIEYILGNIVTYYIKTRDEKIHSYDELLRLYSSQDIVPFNMKKDETVGAALKRNIIDEGYVTHSFNGCNKKIVKKYGLGNSYIYKDGLLDVMKRLEKAFKFHSEYVSNQSYDETEIYYTSPGSNSIFYAMYQVPERLYLGPLRQLPGGAVPITIGESKRDYYMKVLAKKIVRHCDVSEYESLMKDAEKIVDAFCTQKPCIAFIPIKSRKFELNASIECVSKNPLKLGKFIEAQALKKCGSVETFANKHFFANNDSQYSYKCADLVSTGVSVPAEEIEIVQLLDRYEFLQRFAVLRYGLKEGDKIDYFKGKQIEQIDDELQKIIDSHKSQNNQTENNTAKKVAPKKERTL